MPGPLDGVTVIEMGQLLAGPYCGQLLGDLGATVIKLEPPGVGDPLRNWGREKADGAALWWPIAARNKHSVTCNLRAERGQDLARRLAADADMVLENFRPGTMERWHLGPDDLWALNPRLIMIRVSGFGQTGPYATRPGYASIGEAMGGLRYVVGDPSAPPSRTGVSMGDSLAALFATVGALAALHRARETGQGQVVDAAIYESVFAIMESLVPEYALADFIRERTGSFLPNVAPSNIYPTADDQWILIAANQDSLFRRLGEAMGRPGLADDPRFVDHTARGDHQAQLDAPDERVDANPVSRRAAGGDGGALGRGRADLPGAGDARRPPLRRTRGDRRGRAREPRNVPHAERVPEAVGHTGARALARAGARGPHP